MRISLDDLLGVPHLAARNLEGLKRSFSGVSTDSRKVGPGEIFFALRGEALDGHAFLRNAFNAGASCAVVDEKADPGLCGDSPHVVVRDTTKAFGELAGLYRRKFDIPVIAIAGSNGKTTTKEMTTRVLKTRYSVHSTEGNHNNNIGVPATIFGMSRRHDMAVLELGTNHFGEIRYLCGIARPTHGLITNIGREHLEFFGDLDGVTRAEGELFDALLGSGTGIVNADDQRVVRLAKKLRHRATYGFRANAGVRGKVLSADAGGRVTFQAAPRGKRPFTVRVPVPGAHAMANALAAAAVGVLFAVRPAEIRRALGTFTAVDKRMQIRKTAGVTIINDTYNANPDSVASALETLRSMQCRGRRIAILADMLELGGASEREHRRIGELIGRMGIDCLLTYGSKARLMYESAKAGLMLHFDEKNVLAEYALELVTGGDIVLVKGSRGMRMEDVVLFIHERLKGKGR